MQLTLRDRIRNLPRVLRVVPIPWGCPKWRLVYANNGDGSTFSGSLTDLTTAVTDAWDIKVRTSEPEFHDIDVFLDLDDVTLSTGEDPPIVSGLAMGLPSTDFSLATGKDFVSPAAHQMHIFNTTGKWRIVGLGQPSDAELTSDTHDRRMWWYARPGWELVYENDAFGNTISGNVRDFKREILRDQARSLKVSYEPSDTILWVRRLPYVTITEDEDGGTPVISGVRNHIIDTDLVAGFGRDVASPRAFEWQIFNTSGNRENWKFESGNASQPTSDTTSQTAMKWYADDA